MTTKTYRCNGHIFHQRTTSWALALGVACLVMPMATQAQSALAGVGVGATAGTPVAAATLGMFVDAQGANTLTLNGSKKPVRVLDYVSDNSVLSVPANGKVSLTLYQTKKMVRITGPSTIKVSKDGLQVLEGNAPVDASTDAKANPRLLSAASSNEPKTAGAIRLRGIRPSAAVEADATVDVDAKTIRELRPGSEGTLEQWVLYAHITRQHNVQDEFQLARQQIRRMRPDLDIGP